MHDITAKICRLSDSARAFAEQRENDRVWRLRAQFADEVAGRRYTFAEIVQWLAFDAPSLAHRSAYVTAVCERPESETGEFVANLSAYFDPGCGKGRRRAPSLAELNERISRYFAAASADKN